MIWTQKTKNIVEATGNKISNNKKAEVEINHTRSPHSLHGHAPCLCKDQNTCVSKKIFVSKKYKKEWCNFNPIFEIYGIKTRIGTRKGIGELALGP